MNAFSKYQKERDKPAPSFLHSVVQTNLAIPLRKYQEKYTVVMELDMRLPPDDWFVVPDFAILPKMKTDYQNDILVFTLPPNGVIDILNENQPLSHLIERKNKYFQHGVKSCWIVIPQFKNVYVYSSPSKYEIFKENDTLMDKNLDLSFSLKEVFE